MQEIADFLAAQYMFDMRIMCQWWMWAPVGLTAIAYAIFMVFKWSLFTLPVTLLFRNAIQGAVAAGVREWKNAKHER